MRSTDAAPSLIAESAPPTLTIARPAASSTPLVTSLVTPPRPLYAAEELVPAASAAASAAHSPFLDDALFRLEDPGPGAWLLRVSKDPTQLCQDSFACDPSRRVYAVTDGVSRSFMPAAWARIVAQAAVAHPEPFAGESDFSAWLDAAAERWRRWMREVWLPQAQAAQAHAGRSDAARDWSAEIDGQGAQTTLVYSSIGGQPRDSRAGQGKKGKSGSVRVDVTAVGDAECLLFRQVAGRWELVEAFPLEHPADFGASPATLSTRRDPARVAAMYRSLRRASLDARPGDRLALATDAVARWLLARAQPHAPDGGGSGRPPYVNASGRPPDVNASGRPPDAPTDSATPSPNSVGAGHVPPARLGGEDPLARVLDDPAGALRLAQMAIDAGRLEDDDLTLLVIAIA